MYTNIKKYQNNTDFFRKTLIVFILLYAFSSCTFLKRIHTESPNDQSGVVVEWDDDSANNDNSSSNSSNTTTTNNTSKKNNNNGNTVVENSEPKIKTRTFYTNYSKKFGYELSGDENKDLITEIDTWLGTPYKYGGKTKQKGTDCSGFVGSVISAVYKKEISRSSTDMYNDVTPVKKSELQEGDLIFFKIDGKRISHVGIYISNNKFAHASTKRGVVINDLDENYYKTRFYSGGRIEK